jgi:antitoxin (DNA-binding transcriptional repressor) of toxin-antitoxin stability system
MTMPTERTIAASEFKAKCLALFDALAQRKLARISITKRGRVVAVLTPPEEPDFAELHGFMRGSVVAPQGFDFTAPALDEPLSAAAGRLHE